MGCHISAVPNGVTGRTTSITYRGHVAMMCGSFGLELNPHELSAEEAAAIPSIMEEAHRVNPLVITGQFFRLANPQDSNWPAVQFVSAEGDEALVLAFQQLYTTKPAAPPLRLQGLDKDARYFNSADNGTYSGSTYMNAGINLVWERGDYKSQAVWLERR